MQHLSQSGRGHRTDCPIERVDEPRKSLLYADAYAQALGLSSRSKLQLCQYFRLLLNLGEKEEEVAVPTFRIRRRSRYRRSSLL